MLQCSSEPAIDPSDPLRTGRILYVSSVDISAGDGPAVNEIDFICTLHEHLGDRVHFLIPRPEHSGERLPRHVCSYCVPHRAHHPLPYLLHQLSLFRALRRLLAQHAFTMVVLRVDVLPLALAYGLGRTRVPYAIKTLGQGVLTALTDRGGWVGKTLDAPNRRLLHRLVRGAVAVDACSTAMIEQLESALDLERGTITWIDNTVNTKWFEPRDSTPVRERLGLQRFRPIVGYVGSRPWERGAMQLVEVAPRLARSHPDLGLLVVGGGDGLAAVRARAAELGVEQRCIFTGHVPFEQVPELVNALDVGVSISLRADRFAAAELKVRQYLACGKPVVATPGSNDFLMNADLGSIVEDPRDLDVIATEIERWLALPDTDRAAFARRARRYMCEHLSTDAGVTERLRLWGSRLPARADTGPRIHA